MSRPIRLTCHTAAAESLGLLLSIARRSRARQDDRIQFATTIRTELAEVGDGLQLRFDQPDTAAEVRHGGGIQCSASTIERMVGRVSLDEHKQLDEAMVSLSLVDRMNERIRLAGRGTGVKVFDVGQAMMIAIEFDGWVDHAARGFAFQHGGAMTGRIVLTGGRDQQEWAMTFLGDYTAGPIVRTPQPTHPTRRSPISAA